MDPTEKVSTGSQSPPFSSSGESSEQPQCGSQQDEGWEVGERAAELAKMWRTACDSGQSDDAEVLRSKLDREITALHPLGVQLCRKVTQGTAGVISDAEDLWQEIACELPQKLTRYQSDHFRAWLTRTAVHKQIDLARRFGRHTHDAMEDWDEDQRRSSSPTAGTAREEVDGKRLRADLSAYLDESEPPQKKWREMLVVASGLDPRCERDRTPETSPAMRLNQRIVDWADQEILLFPSDNVSAKQVARADLHEQELAYDRCLKRHQNATAQNINRHFWSFLIRPPVWTSVLRSIPIVSINPNETPDINTMVLLMLFDAWIVLEDPGVWMSWMQLHGITNNGKRNFARLWAASPWIRHCEDSSEDATSSLIANPAKLDTIINQMMDSEKSSSDSLSLLDLRPWQLADCLGQLRRESSKWFELIKAARHQRQNVDLPIPFQKVGCDVAAI